MSKKNRFKFKHLPKLLVDTYKAWDKNDPFRLSAVVAYYAVLSLPGLLVIIVNLVGSIWGNEIVQGQVTSEISTALGQEAAKGIQSMMVETQNEEKSLISTILGIATLVYGATGVFYHLQQSINEIWNSKPSPKSSIIKLFIDRARSFAFIMVIGFLLLISFVVTTGINALTGYIKKIFPDIVVYLAFLIDSLVSIGIISLLFALIFKYLPDAKIKWKTVWAGAIITSILFVLGKLLLSFYFGQANPASTYGAAGSIVLVLLWVSYSCLILFFGAQFTWVYGKRYGQLEITDTETI